MGPIAKTPVLEKAVFYLWKTLIFEVRRIKKTTQTCKKDASNKGLQKVMVKMCFGSDLGPKMGSPKGSEKRYFGDSKEMGFFEGYANQRTSPGRGRRRWGPVPWDCRRVLRMIRSS